MARIPVSQAPSGMPMRIQGVEQPLAPSGAFGREARIAGMAAQTIGKASDLMMKYAAQQKEENDAAWVREATENLLTTTDAELRDTLNNKLGKDAQGTSKIGAENFQKEIENIEASAPNRRALEAFKARAFSFKRAALNQYSNHEASQVKKWRLNTAKGQLDTTIKSLGTKWRMPDAWTDLYVKENILPAVKDVARLSGVDEKTLQREVVGSVYMNKIKQNIASGKIVEAEKIFEKHKDKLDENQRTPLLAMMRNRDVDLKSSPIAQKLSDELAAEVRTETEVYGIIKQIEDPDVRKMVSQKFSALQKERIAFQNDKTMELIDIHTQSVQLYNQGEISLTELQSQTSRMPDSTIPQKKAKAWAQKKYKWLSKQKNIRDPQTVPDAYSSLMDQIIKGDINSSEELRTAEFATEVKEKDLEVLEKTLKEKQTLTLARETFRLTQGKEKWTREREYLFMSYALPKILKTNRGDDRKYVQGLVDNFLSPGGIVEGEGFFGGLKIKEEQTFEEAFLQWKKDPESIDIKKFTLDVPEKVAAGINAMFYTKPKMALKWIQLANGDRELAIRLKYNNDVKTALGKRTE